MSLEEKFPAYGGRGPGDLRLGIALAVIATIFMAMRVYVRLFMNKFGTTALMWSLTAWVWSIYTQNVDDLRMVFLILSSCSLLSPKHLVSSPSCTVSETISHSLSKSANYTTSFSSPGLPSSSSILLFPPAKWQSLHS